MIAWKNVALLSLAALVVGCSSTSDKELDPAPLPEFTEKASFEKQWSRSVGDGQGDYFNKLTPAIDGDRIFAADVNGEVMAIDRLSGDVVWKKDLKRPVSGAVGAGSAMVLLGTLKGEVIALDSGSGKRLWKANVSSEVLAAPVTNGEVVVVQTQDDKVIGLDADTGEQLWIAENTPAVLTLRGTGSPVVTNKLAVAGLSSGKVVAYEVNRGLPVWQQRVAIPQGNSELERVVDIDGGLLQSGGTLYVVSYQGRMAGLDLESGQLQWQRDASSYVGLSQGYGSVYVSLDSGTVEGVDERSTSALWSNTQLARRQLTAPVVISNYVVVGDFEGYLHLLNQVDGLYVGREKVDGAGLRARPQVVDNWLYVYGNSGDLIAYTIK